MFLIAGALLLTACGAGEAPGPDNEVAPSPGIHSVDTTFESRGVAVPATIVTPAVDGDVPLPLVVMAHGHGGSRQEGGGFRQVAEAMAERGIASIRMDFPGCGDSIESFTENNLSNMLLDLQAARQFVATEVNVDPERVGLLGYSMGGRLVALLSEIDPAYRAMVMWAPGISDGAEREFQLTFGGEEEYAAHRRQAAEQGSVVYTTVWGNELELGLRWFTDLESSRPQAAIAKYTGPLLVIYGDADEVVLPDVSASAVAAAVNSSNASELRIPGARHGLGFYTERPEIAQQVVESTAEFMSRQL
jgi:dienelactone hydrolase